MLLSEFLASEHSQKSHLVVLGHPVSHSRSPRIHNAALKTHGLDITYHAVDCPEVEIDLIPQLLASPHFRGANVTIPLKQKIIAFLDQLDDSARAIGAVNTIVPGRSGANKDAVPLLLKGYNTDIYGFLKPIEGFGTFPVATILGTGGASRAVRYALEQSGTETIYLVSRSAQKNSTKSDSSESVNDLLQGQAAPNRNKETSPHGTTCITIPYSDLSRAVEASGLIVNTTPVGMFPEVGVSPVPEDVYKYISGKTCYDIIYNPLETMFLKISRKHGAKVMGGLDMFIQQAARSFELWFNDKPMPVDHVRELVKKDLENAGQ